MNAEGPSVVLYQVATVDGRVALSPGVLLMGDVRWPHYDGGGYSAVFARHHPDALLEGSGTLVLPDAGPLDWSDPVPEVEPGHYLPEAVLARATSWFAVVDSRGRVTWGFKEFPYPEWAGMHVLVLVARATPAGYLAYLRREQIPYLVVGQERVDLTEALTTMRTVLGVQTVVATPGAELGGALLREGLIDQLEIEVLPILAGGRRTPVMLRSPDLAPTEPPTGVHLRDATVFADGRVLLSYTVESPAE